jgi:hypothetical protein
MSVQQLCYVSEPVYEALRKNVAKNLERYLSGGFNDLAGSEGWAIPLSINYDSAPLRELKAADGPEAEVFNSLLVWKALSNLTPSLANERRIWTRLTHVDCLEYSRSRWIRKSQGTAAESLISDHFFGESRTRARDDNAIGRLWWNAYIAKQFMPDDHLLALKALLRTADIRSNIVERPWISTRIPVASGIVRAMSRRQSVVASEKNFREFMKAINRRGGGILFERMTSSEVDRFMDECAPA